MTTSTVEEKTHAKRSPSGAPRWVACPGSAVLEATEEDKGSTYARWGTAAHEIASRVLQTATESGKWDPISADAFRGEKITVGPDTFEVDDDMIKCVDEYAAHVSTFWEPGDILMVEVEVPIGHITGEEGATGTSDAIIIKIAKKELVVVDLKTGMGVAVYAPENEQFIMYGDGSREVVSYIYDDFDTVRMVVSQLRAGHRDEWAPDMKTFEGHVNRIREASRRVDKAIVDASLLGGEAQNNKEWVERFLRPGEKQCKFCSAAPCVAMTAEVEHVTTVVASADDFEDLGDNSLSTAMDKVDLVEAWCKAVRGEVEKRLVRGDKVPGYKLVQGKLGNRAWVDEGDVEKDIKALKIPRKEMYSEKLLSPTQAEKALKKNPTAWHHLQKHVTRSPGKPSVAAVTDPREEITVGATADDFDDRQ